MSGLLASVIMATYNQARYVTEALDSLRCQTLPEKEFEVIVINDGSTDDTSEILRGYREGIQLIERENRGLVASCNEGLSLARGRYFARLDSDDFVAPEWLEFLVEALESNPDACCAYPDRYEIQGDQCFYVKPQPDNLYSLEACGTLFQMEAVKKIGGFRDFYWEEYDLYLRLRHIGEFLQIRRPLYMYRKHPNSMTSDIFKRRAGWVQLAREWGVDTLRSVGIVEDFDGILQSLGEENKCQKREKH